MKEFQERNRPKKRSKLLLVFMAIFLVSLLRGSINTYSKEHSSRIEVERVLKEKQDLEKRYEVMSEQSESLKSSIGIESEIRSKFDVVKSGEGVIIIVEKDIPIVEEDKRNVLQKFWDSVKGAFDSDKSPKTPNNDS